MKRAAVFAAIVYLATLHIASAIRQSERRAHVDEAETLQAAIRISRGERIYQDFAEHHPPFFFMLLSTFAPAEGSEAEVDAYVVRGRLLALLFGTIALGSAAWLVWRAAGRAYAPLIFLSLLLSSAVMWQKVFVDACSEPPALALWWEGTLLVLLASGDSRVAALARGLGLGLVVNACLWNPKWPVSSVVIGIIFLGAVLRDLRARWVNAALSLTAAGIVSLAGVAFLAATTGIRAYVGNVFTLTAFFFRWTQAFPMRVENAWLDCPGAFQPIWIVPALVLVLIGLRYARGAFGNPRLVLTFVALAVAALIEIRFVYPYPAMWIHYYVLWSMAGAALLAFLPQLFEEAIGRVAPNLRRFAVAGSVIVTLLALAFAETLLPLPGGGHHSRGSYVRAHLAPADTVWIELDAYPLGAHDAGYYWFGFRSFTPASLAFARTPRGARILPPLREEDLPPCRLERGLEPHLRFISRGEYLRLPIAGACVERLLARGMLAPTPVHSVYEVIRK